MDAITPVSRISEFMASHIPGFFNRFGIDFCIDGPQLEYYVYRKQNRADISCSLTLNYDTARNCINVMTFYPGLNQQPGTHFFSAVCFFMVMHHLAQFYTIKPGARVCLSTRQGVFDKFYASLKDFDFYIHTWGDQDRVEIESTFPGLDMDVSMILERPLADT